MTLLGAAPLACTALFGVDDLSFHDSAAGGASSSTTSTGTGGGGSGAGGTGGGTGASGGNGGVGLADYAYRRRLTIESTVALPAAYSLAFDVDHQAAVDEGKARGDGMDLRVALVQNGVAVAIDRVLEPLSSWGWSDTRLWFATQSAVAADDDGGYYLYYGNPNPEDGPQDDGAEVFIIWEDFDGPPDSAWSFTEIGGASGSAQVAGGLLTLTSNGDHVFETADHFVFYHRTIAGDFVARAHTVGMSGDHDDWSNLGGMMVRADLSAASRNVVVSPPAGPVAAFCSYRIVDGATTGYLTYGNGLSLPTTTRLDRLGDNVTGRVHTNDWVTFGSYGLSPGLPEAVLVGIPHATSNSSMVGSAETDWFLARKRVEPEPVVTVGDEEAL